MSSSRTLTDVRHDRASRALSELGSHRSDHQRLGIQCTRAHHVAAIYTTSAGLVYEARTGPHSHGSKDFIDTGTHGSRGGTEYVDLLVADVGVEDELPAWCDCGPRTLSRADLLAHVRAGARSVRIE